MSVLPSPGTLRVSMLVPQGGPIMPSFLRRTADVLLQSILILRLAPPANVVAPIRPGVLDLPGCGGLSDSFLLIRWSGLAVMPVDRCALSVAFMLLFVAFTGLSMVFPDRTL